MLIEKISVFLPIILVTGTYRAINKRMHKQNIVMTPRCNKMDIFLVEEWLKQYIFRRPLCNLQMEIEKF